MNAPQKQVWPEGLAHAAALMRDVGSDGCSMNCQLGGFFTFPDRDAANEPSFGSAA